MAVGVLLYSSVAALLQLSYGSNADLLTHRLFESVSASYLLDTGVLVCCLQLNRSCKKNPMGILVGKD